MTEQETETVSFSETPYTAGWLSSQTGTSVLKVSYIILTLRSVKLTLAGEDDLIMLIRFNDNADHYAIQ